MTIYGHNINHTPEPDWFHNPKAPVAPPEEKKAEAPKRSSSTIPQDQQYQRLKIKYFSNLHFQPFGKPVPPPSWYKG